MPVPVRFDQAAVVAAGAGWPLQFAGQGPPSELLVDFLGQVGVFGAFAALGFSRYGTP